MTKNFQQVEDVLADESFLAWHFRESEEQVMAWENWLAANPTQQALVQEAVVFMQQLAQKETITPASVVEEKLLQLHENIQATGTPVVRMNNTRKRWWWSAAAAVLLIAGAVAFFKFSQPKHLLDAGYGQVCNNQLPDGSTMILNANSTAQLSEGWEDGKDREVWLKGEAFFKVTKTPQHSRFIVHTDNLDVIVTGTQFNVMHRDNKTTVLLTEGHVIIHTKDGKELAMNPGDFVEMADNLVQRKDAKEENVLAWKDNKLAFDSTSIRDVAQIINNHYGVKIRLADDAVASRSLTGIMPNNDLEDLLKAIEFAIDIRIIRTDKEIIFSTKNN